MSSNRELNQAVILLGIGDSTKELVAAPGARLVIFVNAIHWSVVTAAAQLVKIGKDGGTEAEQLLELAASASGVGSRLFQNSGFKMPANTALSAKPAAAGPGIHFVVEYSTGPN